MLAKKTLKTGTMTTAGFIPHAAHPSGMVGVFCPVRIVADPLKFKELPTPQRGPGELYVYALPGGGAWAA